MTDIEKLQQVEALYRSGETNEAIAKKLMLPEWAVNYEIDCYKRFDALGMTKDEYVRNALDIFKTNK